jgi:hypothetical protein
MDLQKEREWFNIMDIISWLDTLESPTMAWRPDLVTNYGMTELLEVS